MGNRSFTTDGSCCCGSAIGTCAECMGRLAGSTLHMTLVGGGDCACLSGSYPMAPGLGGWFINTDPCGSCLTPGDCQFFAQCVTNLDGSINLQLNVNGFGGINTAVALAITSCNPFVASGSVSGG